MSARYPTLRIEGGFFGADLVDSIADGTASGQSPREFGLPDKSSLLDHISAVWSDARGFWSGFLRKAELLSEGDTGTTFTRNQWMVPFFGLLGYDLAFQDRAAEVDGVSYAISHAADRQPGAPPVHTVGVGQSLDRRAESGRPRLAPHSLLQEYLNRTEHTWGVLTNGYTLRLLRDSQLLRRQAYLEFDLRTMFAGEQFADFAVLFRLLHRSRLPHADADSRTCLLERYHEQTVDQGGRVREKLREGVERAIQQLANALLRHPANAILRADAEAGRLSADTIYEELLRLIYRLLFLMVTEERNLLSPHPVYREFYSISRLRALCERRLARNNHTDLWTGLQSTFQLFHTEGYGRIVDAPPLNGDLFNLNRTPHLNGAILRNRDFLDALWCISTYREQPSSPPRHINYAALDVEELGSVYESLLDLKPAYGRDGCQIEFLLLQGTDRKTTGAYYTPPQLVDELVRTSLVPVIEDRLSRAVTAADKEKQLLSIAVCDPACGSGHFLLAAGRRIGRELAKVRSGEDEPTPRQYKAAVRDAIAHCIYGVDKNPLSVELCRVALWLESHAEGKPLSFLDHRIVGGDSLVGLLDLSRLPDGIPEEACKPVTGDDRAVARDAKSQNRGFNRDQLQLLTFQPGGDLAALASARRELTDLPDDTPEVVRRKQAALDRLRSGAEYSRDKCAADMWTYAFFARYVESEVPHGIPTTSALHSVLEGRNPDPQLTATVSVEADRLGIFHWPLEFPEVFLRGGFDIILSNPPWDMLEVEEQEFFSTRDPEIARAPNTAAREELISALRTRRPQLWREYQSALHDAEAVGKFVRTSSRYPLTSAGRNNCYSLFAETVTRICSQNGRIGVVLPTGIATDYTNQKFFSELVAAGRLVSLFSFLELRDFFRGTEGRQPFCVLTLRGATPLGVETAATFSFALLNLEEMGNPQRTFQLTPADFNRLNPNTKTCPIFRTRADADLTRRIYERWPVLVNEASRENPWRISFKQGLFNMASDSGLFRTAPQLEVEDYRPFGNRYVREDGSEYLPLYEAKMIHQYDHRFGNYAGLTERPQNSGLPTPSAAQYGDPSFSPLPWYWVPEWEVVKATSDVPSGLLEAYEAGSERDLAKIMVTWVAGYHLNGGNESFGNDALARYVTGVMASAVDACSDSLLAKSLESNHPLSEADFEVFKPSLDLRSAIGQLIRQRTPSVLFGFRRNARANEERTGLFTYVPRFGVGDSLFLLRSREGPIRELLLLGMLNSLVFDHMIRQKLGGTNMSFYYMKQLPVLPPSVFNEEASRYLVPRLLELVATTREVHSLAEEIWGIADPTLREVIAGQWQENSTETVDTRGPTPRRNLHEEGAFPYSPFKWNEERRARLRAEIDAFYARLYGLSEQDLRFILEPTDVHGPEFPGETFRVLKEKETARFGEYRTKRLVLEAWNRLSSETAASA